MDTPAYHPSLWRTCRVLANRHRLACLNAVLLEPGSTVEQIAAETQLPHAKASLHLRALQARGLIAVRRRSRWAHYQPLPDPLVPSAAPLLKAMRRVLVICPTSEAALLATLTAFTHPRRIAILLMLRRAAAPLSEASLSRATQISSPALCRHLRNLSDRGLVTAAGDGWACAPKPTRLARDLLALLPAETP